MLLAIRAYQRVLSPVMPPACRFEPTCSRYAYEAIERHGAFAGLRLTIHRLWRCRPGMAGGCDPVPPIASRPATESRQAATPTGVVPTAERTAVR